MEKDAQEDGVEEVEGGRRLAGACRTKIPGPDDAVCSAFPTLVGDHVENSGCIVGLFKIDWISEKCKGDEVVSIH